MASAKRWLALAFVSILCDQALAQPRTNGVGIYLDPNGSICNADVGAAQSFDVYVIASHLTGSLQSIVFRTSFPSAIQVLERQVNEALFAPASPLILPGADEWSLTARDCVESASLPLVRYRLSLGDDSANLAVCVEPTTSPASPPTYVTCGGDVRPMQPAYPGRAVQEGCAAFNSTGEDGQLPPVALCSGVLPAPAWSWGLVKARWGG